MRKQIWLKFILPPLILPLAGVAKANTTPACDSDLRTVLHCIAENAPTVARGRAAAYEGQSLGRVAREWRNPELNIQALKAGDGRLSDSLQATGLMTLDLAGVRDARSRSAGLESLERELKLESDQRSTVVQGYLSLLKIRLVQEELSLLKETEKNLERHLAEYERRPRLSAEQQASKTIFTLALQGQKRQRALQEQDYHALIHDLEIQINQSFEPSTKNLPLARDFSADLARSQASPDAPEMKQIENLKEKAKALAQQMRMEKKPQLALGPMLEWDRAPGGQNAYRVGLALQMPLPVFERYAGTSELATRSIERATADASAVKREVEGEMEHAKEVFHSSTQALKEAESPEKTRERIQRVGLLFSQGLVSGATLVEAMRQGLTLIETNNELRLRATAAFCKVRMLENKIEECLQ